MKAVDAHNELANRYMEKKKELMDKQIEVDVIKANVDGKFVENIYLSQQVEKLSKDRDGKQKEIDQLREKLRDLPAKACYKNGITK